MSSRELRGGSAGGIVVSLIRVVTREDFPRVYCIKMEFTALTEEREAFCLPLRSLKFPKYLSELLAGSRRTELSARLSREPSFVL